MKNNILTYFVLSIIVIMFSACGANTTSTSPDNTSYDDGTSYDLPSSDVPSSDHSYISNESVTSFAEDLKLYDIAGLDETKKIVIRKSDDANYGGSDDDSDDDDDNDDDDDDDGSDYGGSDYGGSGDDDSDDDGGSDYGGSGDDDDDSDDSDDDDSDDDDSDDDDSDDDDSDDDDSDDDDLDDNDLDDNDLADESSDTRQTESTELVEEVNQPDADMNVKNSDTDFSSYEEYTGSETLTYEKLGMTSVSLNNKNYAFEVVKDNIQERVEEPSFTSVGDGSYTISITSYAITDDILKKEDGIFTFVITVPSLNTSGMYKVESNVLTNSAKNNVYATVAISQDQNGITFSAIVSEFQVMNRQKTKSYNASFSISYSSK